jgi:hypothetical protein
MLATAFGKHAPRLPVDVHLTLFENMAELKLSVKGVILILVALGMGTMWEAVFGDVGVALLAVLNSMRAMKTENI